MPKTSDPHPPPSFNETKLTVCIAKLSTHINSITSISVILLHYAETIKFRRKTEARAKLL